MRPLGDAKSVIDAGASAFLDWLNSAVLDEIVEHMNQHFALPLMSKLPSELLPTHQRNLTDVRTRIGVLLEYSFALALQHAIETRIGTSYRISYVVANRYPDVVIRNVVSEPILRLEVKALELASEEKSANFDVLVRDVRPDRDILCILLWEWQDADYAGREIEFPEVKRGFAFEAYPIARARDLGWLSERKRAEVKGIDVTGPVVGSADSLRQEEHNMGKLMRILDDKHVVMLPRELAEHQAAQAYRDFKNFTISAGLAHNAARLLSRVGVVCERPDRFAHSARSVQTVARGSMTSTGKDVVVAAGERLTASRLGAYIKELQSAGISSATVLVFSGKFSWSIYDFDGTAFKKISRGSKFEAALANLRSILSR